MPVVVITVTGAVARCPAMGGGGRTTDSLYTFPTYTSPHPTLRLIPPGYFTFPTVGLFTTPPRFLIYSCMLNHGWLAAFAPWTPRYPAVPHVHFFAFPFRIALHPRAYTAAIHCSPGVVAAYNRFTVHVGCTVVFVSLPQSTPPHLPHTVTGGTYRPLRVGVTCPPPYARATTTTCVPSGTLLAIHALIPRRVTSS